MKKNYFCAKYSQDNNDSLIGTASVFKKLLLIEYNDSFLNQAFKESCIDEKVKNKIENEFLSDSDTKLLLIKKSGREFNTKGIRIFAIFNDFNSYSFNRFVINTYLDILSVDFKEIFTVNNYSNPFYLVCTNGKKDKCCGKFGMKIYKDLISKEVNVWQCSHVGGDRFAPNIIVVPYFINYGHVKEKDLEEIIDATNKKKIFLKNYRGTSSLLFSSQAAEGFIRKKYKDTIIGSLKFIDSKKIEKKLSLCTFKLADNTLKTISVLRQKSTYYDYLTCTSDKKGYSVEYITKEI